MHLPLLWTPCQQHKLDCSNERTKITLLSKASRHKSIHFMKTWHRFLLGSVWIGLILLKLKTYCWNHYSKIIFKCVNNAVGPIFNEKIDKKWNLWIRKQCTDVLFMKNWLKVAATVHIPYMNSSRKWGENAWKKKKGKTQKQNADAYPNIHRCNVHGKVVKSCGYCLCTVYKQ